MEMISHGASYWMEQEFSINTLPGPNIVFMWYGICSELSSPHPSSGDKFSGATRKVISDVEIPLLSYQI